MSIILEDYIDNPEILALVRTRNVKNIIQERRGSFMGEARMPSQAQTKAADVDH